ncbi:MULTISPECIES: bifunctional 3-(3-hydroxy-phenyl)propionate/3-hydroxycinnamic acid hydroxylase [Sphingobium]|jgi:3-(3-hydroxy-phenyl)propionate hydroxylase|uniref:Bifunctional 3-(3-hydroxy-phenyl)propionate/3-hydroxycinnamic acid hydroxylase n=1 Tax=Sphingobium tyrosinilyticum TaxID=2715436 RepID=A0ABV9F085_9SPHN|nr:bifunctional 3-(3-hydroxy-phenyl)propionate/3-hydroxycinnamic acid hydroxylase [Sphingobium sp. EP60837]ANI79448.1 3-(3-hydroxy-phenyl)propanoic acid hydroxylase [Sphingobium sp. EP60837]
MFDVAIIGCGPVGAFAANLLGKAGLSVLVVEQEAQPYPLPRAVHLDHEMMRLFQSAGVIDRVAPDMRDTEGHLHVGADHGVIRYMGTVGRPRPFSWSNDYFFYQPELEQHLRNALAAYPNVAVQLGTAFEGLEQDDEAVTLRLSGNRTERARYVIACDGSRSAVRKALGIALDDLDFEEPWLVVDAEVDGPVRFPDLWGVPKAADLQKLSVMICDPKRPATIVPGRGNHRRWEFMLLPGEDDSVLMQPDNVAALVAPYLTDVPHKIVRAATYRFHGLIAEQWRQGRVFLAGDAAHQTPPFFGQGMCHGLRDIANLAWKLELALADRAPATLLDSYQTERDPHVRAVISAAVAAGRYICMLDPAQAAARDTQMREAAKSVSQGTAADLIPPIAQGIVATGMPGAGERFIQPCVNGQLLDDITGSGWRLFSRAPIDAPTEITVVLITEGAIEDWLTAHDAQAVLVRPDHYVFGTGAPADLLAQLEGKLRP